MYIRRGRLKIKVEAAFLSSLLLQFQIRLTIFSGLMICLGKKIGKKAREDLFKLLSFSDCVPEPVILLLFPLLVYYEA